MKLKLHPLMLGFLLLVSSVGILAVATQAKPAAARYQGAKTFWEYQCIDTMKTSRDKAREWSSRPDLKGLIDSEMALIAGTGANCVAIDTPYDPEFAPVLKTWVQSARSHNLHIWFRGNFSAWEGWFDHPKGMTETQLQTATASFIITNPTLFEDGDIFTAAPEAENGGPFNQVEPSEYATFRSFLTQEAHGSAAAFAAIHKQVRVNWASMNGGLARRMLTKSTVDSLGGIVAIDHYIKTSAEMGHYIDYFASTFGAKVVVGEWGAPIPEINGAMTPDEQAGFIDQLLAAMAVRSSDIEAVNYWSLTDGSTRLVDDGLIKRPAYDTIKRYYSPAVLKGTVKNQNGHPLANTNLTIGGNFHITTDPRGNYSILVPSGITRLTTNVSGYTDYTGALNLPADQETTFDLILKHAGE